MSDGEDQDAATAPAAWEPDTETEARALGWKSPDEWKGEVPAGYIDDPKRYLDRAEGFAPFRKIKDRLTEVEKAADERLRRIEQATMRAVERERASHAEELTRLRAEKARAFDEGDKAAFEAAERKQEALQKAAPEPAAQSGMAEIEAWAVNKPWFGNKAAEFDPIMTSAAGVAWEEAARKGISDPKAILAHVDKRLAEAFPHKFPKDADAPAKQSSVEGGLTFGGGSGGDGFAKLPKSARDAFARFVQQGLYKDDKESRETYLKDYNA